MTRRVLHIAYKKFTSLGRDESGAALVITLAVFFFMFMLVSGVYALGVSVNRRIELQNACDAAAYSAAVVQADGLSRMAVVNRAMSWTYVQMVRRQMDYITYRWLKLTHKRFQEDYKEAKSYHWCLNPLCPKRHNTEGPGWWCGQGPNETKKIRINMRADCVDADELGKNLDQWSQQMGDDKSSGGGSSTSSSSGSSSNATGMNPFNDDDMFTTGESKLTDVQKQFIEIMQQYAGQLSEDEMFTKWFQMNGGGPEPPKYIQTGDGYIAKDHFGQPKINQAWTEWNNRRRDFVEKNKITEDSYGDATKAYCKVCGKAMLEADHTKCYEQWNAKLEAQQQQQEQQEQAASGGQCPICNAPKGGGTHKYCNWAQGMAKQIQNDKETIEMLNASLTAINLNMILGMKETARNMLEFNLPKDADGNIDNDFLYTLHIPTGSDPYAADASDPSLTGFFSPLYNTEEHETIFLNMADGQVPDALPGYFNGGDAETNGLGQVIDFVDNLLGGGEKAQGLDQWFIRTYPQETKIANQVSVVPKYESYHALGICRCYKNANREEGRSTAGFHRGNHIMDVMTNVSGGGDMLGLSTILKAFTNVISDLLDITPSCQNRRVRFPDMCAKVDDSIALVSQYRWASAKWFCFFVVYPFGIKWFHPYLPQLYCKAGHGYGTWLGWIFKEIGILMSFQGVSRNDYRQCWMGLDVNFSVKGHARIYGDDKDLVNEQYVGVPARPWLINEKFFAGDGTITVGLARKQRNPWQKLLNLFDGVQKPESPNPSRGLMTLFNVHDGNYLWTVSTARAAYRRRSDGWDGQSLSYDVKFDSSVFPDALKINYAEEATSDMRELRVGCVCTDGENKERLRHAWNLCTPDWEATLIPVRYSRAYLGKYEHWNAPNSTVSWAPLGEGGARVFQMMSDMDWNGFDDTSMPGSAITHPVDIRGKQLNNLQQLERLKIY